VTLPLLDEISLIDRLDLDVESNARFAADERARPGAGRTTQTAWLRHFGRMAGFEPGVVVVDPAGV
jgi:hypothetical protein